MHNVTQKHRKPLEKKINFLLPRRPRKLTSEQNDGFCHCFFFFFYTITVTKPIQNLNYVISEIINLKTEILAKQIQNHPMLL